MFTRNLLLRSPSSVASLRAISHSRIQYPSRTLAALSASSQNSSLSSQRIGAFQAQRWYSDSTPISEEKKASEQSSTTSQPPSESKSSELDTLKEQIAAKDKQIVELKDQYLRSVADYKNLQARTQRETAKAQSFALEKFVRDLLSSIDNLEAALISVPESKLTAAPTEAANGISPVDQVHRDLVNLHEGLKMTEEVLMRTLTKHGVERYDPSATEGEKFDPSLHEAMFLAPKAGAEDGTVMHTQRKGISLNGRVIRAAQVGVVKNS